MTADLNCRHEHVKFFQRKLKGLERRLVATRAYLPVGFKIGDFSHLGEGGYCFCINCRLRLHPKRTQADKEAARQALAVKRQAGILDDTNLDDQTGLTGFAGGVEKELGDQECGGVEEVHVEELEVDCTDVQDVRRDGVGLNGDWQSCQREDERQ